MIEPFNSALANFSRMRVDGCSRNDFSSRIGEARIYINFVPWDSKNSNVMNSMDH